MGADGVDRNGQGVCDLLIGAVFLMEENQDGALCQRESGEMLLDEFGKFVRLGEWRGHAGRRWC